MPATMKTLNNISRCQAMYRKKIISAENLCPNHYAFVLAVCRRPGLSQEELAGELCLDKSTVARAVAYLEKHSYIIRILNEKDRRQYLVHPSEKMLNVCPKVQLANREWNERLTEEVSPEEMDVFCRVLSKMEQSAKRITEESEVK